jgi:uncharacterized membrane protein
MRISVAALLEGIGFVLLLIAAAAWDWRLALALLGVLLVVAGNLLDRQPDRNREVIS